MTILEHAGIPEVMRRIYELEVEVTRLAVQVAEHFGCHGCCGTDRPEDCGDCLCPERNRWNELERQPQPM